jgi:hypothetical protein
MATDIYVTSGKWLRVVSESFFGPCVRSPNGRYVLAWRDSTIDPDTTKVTRRGMFILLDAGRIQVRGRVRKVLTASVSDPGIFLIACGPRRVGELEGTVYAIGPHGEPLVEHRINALLGPSAISSDGHFAVCQATNNDEDDSDSGKLHFFDVTARSLSWKRRPETGWASRYELDTGRGVLFAYNGTADPDRCYRYSFDGSCLDLERWERRRAEDRARWLQERASAYELLHVARRHLTAATSDGAGENDDELLALLRRGLERRGSDRVHAQVRRLIDEIADKTGKPRSAVGC